MMRQLSCAAMRKWMWSGMPGSPSASSIIPHGSKHAFFSLHSTFLPRVRFLISLRTHYRYLAIYHALYMLPIKPCRDIPVLSLRIPRLYVCSSLLFIYFVLINDSPCSVTPTQAFFFGVRRIATFMVKEKWALSSFYLIGRTEIQVYTLVIYFSL